MRKNPAAVIRPREIIRITGGQKRVVQNSRKDKTRLGKWTNVFRSRSYMLRKSRSNLRRVQPVNV